MIDEFKPGDRVRIKEGTPPSARTWATARLPEGAELEVIDLEVLDLPEFRPPPGVPIKNPFPRIAPLTLDYLFIDAADIELISDGVSCESCRCTLDVLMSSGCRCGGK